MYVGRAGYILRDNPDHQVPFMIAMLCMMGGLTAFALIGTKYGNQTGLERASKIDGLLTKELKSTSREAIGEDLQSFHTRNIIFNENEPNIVRFVGVSTSSSGREYNSTQVTYMIGDNDFEKLIKYYKRAFIRSKPDSIDTTDANQAGKARFILEHLLEVLPFGELVDVQFNNVKSVNSEMVLDLGTPRYEASSDEVWCDMTLIKYTDGEIKIATVEVSSKATEELKANPKLLYSLPRQDLHFQVERVDTYHDKNMVTHVGDDWAVC